MPAGRKGDYTIEREGNGITYTGTRQTSAFEEVLRENLEQNNFSYNGKEYVIVNIGDMTTVYEIGNQSVIADLTNYDFEAYDDASIITDSFREGASAAT